MAICTYCEQEMLGGSSCSVEVMHRDGAPFPLKKVSRREVPPATGACGDCGAPAGGYHHLGCCVQRCPRCRGQMMSCGCWFDEDGLAIADNEELFYDFVAVHWEGRWPEAS